MLLLALEEAFTLPQEIKEALRQSGGIFCLWIRWKACLQPREVAVGGSVISMTRKELCFSGGVLLYEGELLRGAIPSFGSQALSGAQQWKHA
jgi:hypothetical protein